MELCVLALFCVMLLVCILTDTSILFALVAGLLLFLLHGKKKGFTWKELLLTALSGVKKAKNILISFALIGMLTALWRDAGTIPTIVCYAVRLIRPSILLVMTFLLNCLVSFLTGTAFGTAATMGVICATIAAAVGLDPVLTGGAVLSGVFFGDRCSPVSTSALLVSELTGTKLFHNIRSMLRSSLIPFLLACLLYAVIGAFADHAGAIPDLQSMFSREFSLSLITLLPAVVILVLSLLQVNVKIAMTASILTALPISLFVQHTPPAEIPGLLVSGFSAADASLHAMLNGGGVLSMVKVACIVCLSSSYSGIFQKTGLLDGAQHAITALAGKTTTFLAVLCTSVIGSMVACNQTLAIMLTHQLCSRLEPDSSRMALYMEDTAVVVAPLVPWSIAGAVPLATVGSPTLSILYAFFLILLPLWQLAVHTFRKTRRKAA